MKFVAHILLFVFFFVAVGTSVFFFLELSQARQDSQSHIRENKKVVALTFTTAEYGHLKWTEENKEFRLHGKMYDVSSVETDRGLIHILCVFDKKETGLRKKLNDFFSNRPDKNFPARQLIKVLSQKYFSSLFDSLPTPDSFLILLPTPYFFCVHSFENEVTGPPPRG